VVADEPGPPNGLRKSSGALLAGCSAENHALTGPGGLPNGYGLSAGFGFTLVFFTIFLGI